MRWIFTYNEAIKKHIEKVLKTKIKVEPQPWLHIAVKTVSKRNPWAGFVIYVWDTREIVKSGEYRSKTGKFETSNFTGVPGLRRAKDNRQPLKGGKGDVNKFFEFEVDKSAECNDVTGTELFAFGPGPKAGNENVVVVGIVKHEGKLSVQGSEFDDDGDPKIAWHEEMRNRFKGCETTNTKVFRDSDYDSDDEWEEAINDYKDQLKSKISGK